MRGASCKFLSGRFQSGLQGRRDRLPGRCKGLLPYRGASGCRERRRRGIARRGVAASRRRRRLPHGPRHEPQHDESSDEAGAQHDSIATHATISDKDGARAEIRSHAALIVMHQRHGVDSVQLLSASSTPIANEVVADSGLSNDNGSALRLGDGFYVYNLSTQGWTSTAGARFRVLLRVQRAGHIDTTCEVFLVNR
jgi:hypothetical protein